jgi:hypothetical protein
MQISETAQKMSEPWVSTGGSKKMHTIKLNVKKYKGSKSLPTLSASEVRQIVSDLIAEHLQLQAEGYDCSTQVVTDVLVKASVEGETIESVCNDLEAVPTGHTVRNYLNEQLRPEDLATIEERVNGALTADLPKRLWGIRLDLAADLHDEPFYGKTEELLAFALARTGLPGGGQGRHHLLLPDSYALPCS